MPALDVNIVPARTPAVPSGGNMATSRTARPGAARTGAAAPHGPAKGGGFGELVARYSQEDEGESAGGAVKSGTPGKARGPIGEGSDAGDREDRAKDDTLAAPNATGGIATYHNTFDKHATFPWTLPLQTALFTTIVSGESAAAPGTGESASESEGAIGGAAAGMFAAGANDAAAKTGESGGDATAAADAVSGASIEMVNTLVSQVIAASAGTAETAMTAGTAADTTSAAGVSETTGDWNNAGPAVDLAASVAFTQTPGKEAINGSLARNVATDPNVAAKGPDTGVMVDTGLPSNLSFAPAVAATNRAADSTTGADVPSVPQNNIAATAAADITIAGGDPAAETPAAVPSPTSILTDHARRQATRELLRAMRGDAAPAAPAPSAQAGATVSSFANLTATPTPAGDASASAAANVAIASNEASPRLADKAKNAPAADTFTSNGAAAHAFAADGSSSDSHGAAQQDGGRDDSGQRWTAARFGAESHAAANIGAPVDAAPAPVLNPLTSSLADSGQAAAIGAAIGSQAHASSPLGAGSSNAAAGHAPLIDTTASADDQSSQIVRSMRLQWRGNAGEATLRLQPEHLGTVLVNVKVDAGAVTATLHAETPAAQQWIQTHQQHLRDALDAQGLRVANLHVTTNPDDRPRRDREQEQGASEQDTPRGRNRRRDANAPTFEIRI